MSTKHYGAIPVRNTFSDMVEAFNQASQPESSGAIGYMLQCDSGRYTLAMWTKGAEVDDAGI